MSDDIDESPRSPLAFVPRRAFAAVMAIALVVLGLMLWNHAKYVGRERLSWRNQIYITGPIGPLPEPDEAAVVPIPPWDWTANEWRELFLWWR